MAVSYRKLFFLLNKKGLKKYFLRQNGINPKVVDALSKNKNVNVSSIMDLCRLFNCQPSDIMEYVSDENNINEVNKKNAKINMLCELFECEYSDIKELISEEDLKKVKKLSKKQLKEFAEYIKNINESDDKNEI